MRLIDADKVLELLKVITSETTAYNRMSDVVNAAETIEPRNHAKWLYDSNTDECICGNCGNKSEIFDSECFFCHSKMNGIVIRKNSGGFYMYEPSKSETILNVKELQAVRIGQANEIEVKIYQTR